MYPLWQKTRKFQMTFNPTLQMIFFKETRFDDMNVLLLLLSSYRNISILQKHKDLNINCIKHDKSCRKYPPPPFPTLNGTGQRLQKRKCWYGTWIEKKEGIFFHMLNNEYSWYDIRVRQSFSHTNINIWTER